MLARLKEDALGRLNALEKIVKELNGEHKGESNKRLDLFNHAVKLKKIFEDYFRSLQDINLDINAARLQAEQLDKPLELLKKAIATAKRVSTASPDSKSLALQDADAALLDLKRALSPASPPLIPPVISEWDSDFDDDNDYDSGAESSSFGVDPSMARPRAILSAANPGDIPTQANTLPNLLNQYPLGLTKHVIDALKESKLPLETYEIKSALERMQEGQANLAQRAAGAREWLNYQNYKESLDTQIRLLQEMQSRIASIAENPIAITAELGVDTQQRRWRRPLHQLTQDQNASLVKQGFDFRDEKHQSANLAFKALQERFSKFVSDAFLPTYPDLFSENYVKLLKATREEIHNFSLSGSETKDSKAADRQKKEEWIQKEISREIILFEKFIHNYHYDPAAISEFEIKKEYKQAYEEFLHNGDSFTSKFPLLKEIFIYIHQKKASQEIFLGQHNLFDAKRLLDNRILQLQEQQQDLALMQEIHDGYDSTVDQDKQSLHQLSQEDVLLSSNAIHQFDCKNQQQFKDSVSIVLNTTPAFSLSSATADIVMAAAPSKPLSSRIKMDVSTTSEQCTLMLAKVLTQDSKEEKNDEFNIRKEERDVANPNNTFYFAGKIFLEPQADRKANPSQPAPPSTGVQGILVPKLAATVKLSEVLADRILNSDPKLNESFKNVPIADLKTKFWQAFKGPFTQSGFTKFLSENKQCNFSKNPFSSLANINTAAKALVDVFNHQFKDMLFLAQQLSDDFNRVSSNKPAHLIGNDMHMLYFIKVYRTAIMRLAANNPKIKQAYAFTGGNDLHVAEADVVKAMGMVANHYADKIRATFTPDQRKIYAGDIDKFKLKEKVSDTTLQRFVKQTALPAHHTAESVDREKILNMQKTQRAADLLDAQTKKIAQASATIFNRSEGFEPFPAVDELKKPALQVVEPDTKPPYPSPGP